MTMKRTRTLNTLSALSFSAPSINRLPNRRLFLKGAALSLLGLTVLGVDSPALAATASDATLAALSGAQAEYEAAMAELSSIGSQLEDAQYRLAKCQGNLDATVQQISDLTDSILQKQADLSAAQDLLADRVNASYRAGNTDMIGVLLDASSFEDFVSRLYYAGKVSDSDSQAIQSVKDIKAELEAEEAQLQEQRAQQEQLVAEQQAYTDELAGTVAQYEQYTASLSAEVTALMSQAQAELIAAQQAEYEAYLAAQQASQTTTSSGSTGSTSGSTTGSSGSTSTPDSAGNSSDAVVDSGSGDTAGGSNSGWDDGSSDDGGWDSGSTGGDSYDDGGWDSGYSGGNHAYSVADIAWNYIGVPYVWGGTDPSGFDCSGLAQYCYAQAGYSIGRNTYAQADNISARGQMTYNMDDLQPGDLVFPHDGHVGIYMGGGMMIHAPQPGEYVKYASVYAFSFGGCPV